jgi:hypothetical protein
MKHAVFPALAAAALLISPARAGTQTIYVAPRDSPAAAAAQAKANGSTTFAERTLQRALDLAGELLAKGGPADVNVFLAEGSYEGKAGSGIWTVPPINNPAGSLRIAGGFNAEFSSRDPFGAPSVLLTVFGRGGPILGFSRGTRLREIVISGLVLDAGPSNTYDTKTNSILKAQSRSYPILGFTLAVTDHLVIADNVFLNAAHQAFEPYIVPATAEAVVDIQNNFFINNILALTLGPKNPAMRTPLKEINFRNNTVVLNWPYNPDPNSSNVGAIELYHKGSARRLNAEGNLFAYNPGGAFQHDWPENRMPEFILRRNLFFTNATLFGSQDPDAGVLVGKFGPSGKHRVLKLGTIEVDFDYKVEGNVVADPGIKVDQQLTVKPGRGDNVDLSGYAPRVEWDPKSPPFPTNPAARAFGVQRAPSWTPR